MKNGVFLVPPHVVLEGIFNEKNDPRDLLLIMLCRR